VLFSTTIPGNFSDFNTVITRVIGAQSDTVFLNLGVPQMGPMIKRFREQGFKKTIFTNYWSSNKDVMAVVGKEGMNGVVYDIPKGDWPIFSKKLKEQFQVSKPTGNNYSCYTGLATLLTALAKNMMVISGEDVHKSLLATSSVPLADNNLEILGREAQMKIAFYRFVDGETEETN
jgi:ABC-type branched-subunit amino acid transport system substrate-binding protein